MYLLGIDLGTSFIKASIVNVETKQSVASLTYPEKEVPISVKHADWAEQNPDQWWENIKSAIKILNKQKPELFPEIKAIGISYQMHGLVCIDKQQQLLRDSIIWCDSRAVSIGKEAFEAIGAEKCLSHLLNSPGNFTASKLKWVKENEPEIYSQIDKIMLPGDYIALKLTGKTTTSISALSEGIFWDFKNDTLSEEIFQYYGFSKDIIPETYPVFGVYGTIKEDIAKELGLPANTPVSYKAGDQPNNALSLNVLKPGEVAATAGTSGVIYAVTDHLMYDKASRINGFAHVNYTKENPHIGILLNINGVGIANGWVRRLFGRDLSYEAMNQEAALVPPGSEGLQFFPFGNGAERMLENKTVFSQIENINFNIHQDKHFFRAVQEGVAFAFRYGLDIIRENNLPISVIKAAHANMFLSPIFTETFVNTLSIPVELYPVDGSVGAALGAGLGAGIYSSEEDAFGNIAPIRRIDPDKEKESQYEKLYQNWKKDLQKYLA